jgi:protein-L-isoaspartate(D-aspartate) O-methyltransferase
MDYDTLRKRMVEEQLIARGIKDKRVLDAFYKVPRHRFVPEGVIDNAYSDFPLPIGNGQTISQPYIVALMTELLELSATDKVLEIGTGSGYQTAILSELTPKVYSVERFKQLSKEAGVALGELGYRNARLMVGDGTLGWQEESPFERIIITAASPRIPLPLVEQLAEKGKIVIPLGESFSQVLTIAEKINNRLQSREVCGCVFVPLVGKHGYHDY